MSAENQDRARLPEMTWTRSDLTSVGLGRGLIHGERPNHAALSALGGGLIVTDKSGTVMDVDLVEWCRIVGRPMPEELDLRWLGEGVSRG